jgi:hypothetical protein
MKAKKKKKHVIQTIRKTWNIPPVTKVKNSEKIYKRKNQVKGEEHEQE